MVPNGTTVITVMPGGFQKVHVRKDLLKTAKRHVLWLALSTSKTPLPQCCVYATALRKAHGRHQDPSACDKIVCSRPSGICEGTVCGTGA